MTTVDIPIGTTVFVRRNGKVVQAEAIERKGYCDWPPFADWIPVCMVTPDFEGKIVVDGVSDTFMYHKRHVYASAEEAQQAEDAFRQSILLSVAILPLDSSAGDALVRSTMSKPSETWQALQMFKEEHWDQELGHLRADALEDYYQLWRAAVAERHGITLKYGVTFDELLASVISVDLGSSDGDKSSEYTVDTETGEIVGCATVSQRTRPPIEFTCQIAPIPRVSKERNQNMKAKLTKKQLRSTGRIEYADSVQTSLFD